MRDPGRFANVSVVLQGPTTDAAGDPARPSLARVIDSIRTHLPGARVILSTWPDAPVGVDAADEVVRTADPGPLPSLKFHPVAPNNVNRQIVSTAAGLARVDTTHALKMRTDCLLLGADFVAMQRAFPARDARFALFKERVVVPTLYTINPRAIERVPFHVSDWFQFGRTEDLRRLWSAPPLSIADATYFERHSHAPDARPGERAFRARFAVEQYLLRELLKQSFKIEGEFLNDRRAADLELQDRVLANAFVVAAPAELGFVFPKNAWTERSKYYRYACYDHLDWLDLYARYAGGRPGRSPARWLRARTTGLISRAAAWRYCLGDAITRAAR